MNCLLINVKGNIRQSSITNFTKEELCFKCGFKTPQYFEKMQTYSNNINNEKFIIEIWGKNKSRSSNENKYRFPESTKTRKIYGTCIIIRKDEKENCVNLTTDIWSEHYTLIRSLHKSNRVSENDTLVPENDGHCSELEEEEYNYEK